MRRSGSRRPSGTVEIERYRETRTHGRQFPQSRNSESQQRDISREPLVMASEISGLYPLHGYLKHCNYVVRMSVPYLQLEAHYEKFVEGKIEPSSSNGYEAAPTKREPVAVQQMEQKPAQEQQQHFFE
jgi:hypothetical protein